MEVFSYISGITHKDGKAFAVVSISVWDNNRWLFTNAHEMELVAVHHSFDVAEPAHGFTRADVKDYSGQEKHIFLSCNEEMKRQFWGGLAHNLKVERSSFYSGTTYLTYTVR